MTRKFPPRYIPKNLCRFGPRNIYNTTLHMQTTYKTVLLTTVDESIEEQKVQNCNFWQESEG